MSLDFARDVYQKTFLALRPTGAFGENGVKNSLTNCDFSARELLKILRERGFDSDKPVLVSNSGIVNRAHSIAAALSLKMEISVRIVEKELFGATLSRLRELGLEEKILQALAETYLLKYRSTR